MSVKSKIFTKFSLSTPADINISFDKASNFWASAFISGGIFFKETYLSLAKSNPK